MKIRWIVVGVVLVIGLILLLPATGFASYSKREVIVNLNVKAYASSATDATGANSITVDYSNPQSVSYLQYIGIWWGGLIGPGQVLNDSVVYIQVHIRIWHIENDTPSGLAFWTENRVSVGYPYEIGTRFEHTFHLEASHGDTITATVWVCVGDNILSQKSFAGVVP